MKNWDRQKKRCELDVSTCPIIGFIRLNPNFYYPVHIGTRRTLSTKYSTSGHCQPQCVYYFHLTNQIWSFVFSTNETSGNRIRHQLIWILTILSSNVCQTFSPDDTLAYWTKVTNQGKIFIKFLSLLDHHCSNFFLTFSVSIETNSFYSLQYLISSSEMEKFQIMKCSNRAYVFFV